MEEERKIEELQRLIDTHENIVFFGGGGLCRWKRKEKSKNCRD